MRLVTRPDLDGLTCAVLLSHCESVDSVELVEPQEITDRRVAISANDILANLPYHPDCGLWFDNHLLTDARSTPPKGFRGRYGQAPSAARLVYEHYAPEHSEIARHEKLLQETDRLDSAQLTLQDVLTPAGYVLLGFTLDPKSGLGDPRDYFRELLPAVSTETVEAVLARPSVRERVQRLREQDRRFRETALARSHLDGGVVVTDFRGVDPVPVGNRFLVYTLFPEASVSVRVERAATPDRVAVSAGRSIFNNTSRANLGVLMSLYGGGGQPGAAACRLPAAEADARIAEIVSSLKRQS
jgi:hypothetical protein